MGATKQAQIEDMDWRSEHCETHEIELDTFCDSCGQAICSLCGQGSCWECADAWAKD